MPLYAFNAVLFNPKRPDLTYNSLGYRRDSDLETAQAKFSKGVLETNPGFTLQQVNNIEIPEAVYRGGG